MGREDNGLTLEGLAQRLEAMQREHTEKLEALERENTELRSKVATLEGSGTSGRDVLAEKRGLGTERSEEAALAFEGRVSRRSLLSKAGAAAVAAIAAGTLMYPRQAKADHFNPGIAVDWVWAHRDEPGKIAILGQSTGATGIIGEGLNRGVAGISTDGIGVEGISTNSIGVVGVSPAGDHGAVYGLHTGSSGYGVVGDGTGATGAGVLGRNSLGYGGQFEGGKAQLKLKPSASAGKPTSGTHTKGEIYMDKAGALFVCTAGDGTSVGTWKKVNMKLV